MISFMTDEVFRKLESSEAEVTQLTLRDLRCPNCRFLIDKVYSDIKEWTLAGIFADEGISGTQTKKRTEFNRMIRMCKQKKIDLILTKSISRFARNTVDCLEYVRQLKDLGIGVIFEKENINTLTMTSEFMIALYGSFAQAESESISKNVSLGVQMAMAQKIPYGDVSADWTMAVSTARVHRPSTKNRCTGPMSIKWTEKS